jgi:hypothetical protein
MSKSRFRFASILTPLIAAACGASSVDTTPDAADDIDAPAEMPDARPGAPDAPPGAPDAPPGTPDARPTPDAPPGAPDARPPADAAPVPDAAPTGGAIKTVFLILMENHNWSAIKGSSSAPYINNTLLSLGAHAENYYNPPSNHPSEPNYIWLEAGQTFGLTTDNPPSSSNHIASSAHLARQLKDANIPWKTYQEDISGSVCPLAATNKYVPKHDPFVFFDDITGNRSSTDAYCIAHNRPYTELAGDLSAGNVARYNFISPNLCDDMHDSCAPTSDAIRQGDTWLSHQIPMIMASQAYQNGGVIIVVWDEGTASTSDGPIGLIVISSLAKPGYSNTTTQWDHSSTLRTIQEIMGVTPFLGGAAGATDLADLFQRFP